MANNPKSVTDLATSGDTRFNSTKRRELAPFGKASLTFWLLEVSSV